VTSARKLYTNRLNARASTGPKTVAGKARAAQNARRHGLTVAALGDPAMAREIGRLARELAGASADRERFEAACRIVAAQIDLLHIRQARVPLLSRGLADPEAIERLAAIDLYEGYARALRKRGIRELGSARPPAAKHSAQPIQADSGADGIDLAAVLRKLRARRNPRKHTLGSIL
jgi:hypothetical protein